MWLKVLTCCSVVAVLVAASLGEPSHKKPISVLLIPYVDDSHIMRMAEIGEALVKRGHNVTLCTAEKEGSDLPERLTKKIGMTLLRAGLWPRRGPTAFSAMLAVIEGLVLIEDKIVSVPMHTTAWDIVVVDSNLEAKIGCLCMKWNVPHVVFSPGLTDMLERPSWSFPSVSSGYTSKLSFLQRLLLFPHPLEWLRLFYWLTALDPDCNQYYQCLMNMGTCSPFIVATAIGFDYSRPLSPMAHFVGPITSITIEDLPHSLEQWMTMKPNKSVVYISTGTLVEITREMGDALIKGLLQTNYSVVWSLRERNRYILDGHVHTLDNKRFYFSHWLPQRKLLEHPAIALAMSHGGLGGINDAIQCAVPVIAIPFGGNLHGIAARVEETGVGVRLDEDTLTPQKVRKAIESVTSVKYKRAVEKLQKIFQHAGGVDKAADLIEYYSEVGYEHLIPAYVKYKWNWIQYYNADVYAFISVITLACMAVIYKSCKYAQSCCSKMKNKTD